MLQQPQVVITVGTSPSNYFFIVIMSKIKHNFLKQYQYGRLPGSNLLYALIKNRYAFVTAWNVKA